MWFMNEKTIEGNVRYDHLQVLRGIASLMVLFDHAAALLIKNVPDYKHSYFAAFFVPEGFPWVWLFLVISGFLLTKAFVRERFSLNTAGIKSFYRNRFFRLVPLLWFLASLWVLLYYCGLWPKSLPAFNLLREVTVSLALPWTLFFPSVHPVSSMNPPVWSVILEIQIALLMPFLLIALNNSWKKLLMLIVLWYIGIAILAAIVTLRESPVIFPIIYSSHFYNFGFFAAGMLLAFLPNQKIIMKAIPWPVIVGGSISAIGVTQYISFHDINKALAFSPLLLGPVLLLLIAKVDTEYQIRTPSSPWQIWGGRSALKWLQSVGIMSYSVYLVHRPIVYLLVEKYQLNTYVTGLWSYLATLLLLALVVIVISVFLFFGIEDRFRIKRKT